MTVTWKLQFFWAVFTLVLALIMYLSGDGIIPKEVSTVIVIVVGVALDVKYLLYRLFFK